MTAIPEGAAEERVRTAEPRPVITGIPQLHLVAAPARKRGFLGTVITCVALFLGSILTAFVLNTSMVSTAYQIRDVQREISVAQAKEATLSDRVMAASTPEELLTRATGLGMVPASQIDHVDLATGKIISGNEGK